MAPLPPGAVASPPRVAATAHARGGSRARAWQGCGRREEARRPAHLYDHTRRLVEAYRLDVFHACGQVLINMGREGNSCFFCALPLCRSQAEEQRKPPLCGDLRRGKRGSSNLKCVLAQYTPYPLGALALADRALPNSILSSPPKCPVPSPTWATAARRPGWIGGEVKESTIARAPPPRGLPSPATPMAPSARNQATIRGSPPVKTSSKSREEPKTRGEVLRYLNRTRRGVHPPGAAP